MVHRGVIAPEKKPRPSAPALRNASSSRATKRAPPSNKLSGTLNTLAAQPSSSTRRLRSTARAAGAPKPSLEQTEPVPSKRLRDAAEHCEHDVDKENKRPRGQGPLESSAQAHKAALLALQQSFAWEHAPSEPKQVRDPAPERRVEARQSGVGASTGLEPPRQLATAEPFQPWRRDHIALVHSALLGSTSPVDGNIPSSSQSGFSSSSDMSSQGKEHQQDCTSFRGDTTQQCSLDAPFGREQHFADLHKLLRKCCQEGSGRSVYISGLPGTGKSHTVRAVLDSLKQQQQGTQQQFCPIFLSCFSLRDPSDVHRALHAACKLSIPGVAAAPVPASASPQHAHEQLMDLLQSCSKQTSGKRGLKGGKRMVVLVLDEVDRLLLKGTEDMYKLFMLPRAAGVQCCVVAMANSIDITERSLPALKCRGCAPEFMPFTAYSRPQVLSILSSKLSSLPWPVFQEQALELVARKVSSSSGDLRKVFQACRFALGILHDRTVREQEQRDGGSRDVNGSASESQPQQAQGQAERKHGMRTAATVVVNVSDMVAALARLNYQSGSGASVSTIRGLPQQQQLHLLALATSVATASAQAVADAEAEAVAQQHGLTTSAYRTKYYWGPSVLGPKPLQSSNPFATGAQRSVMHQYSSSSGAGAATLGSGSHGSMHSTAGCKPQGSGAAAGAAHKEASGKLPYESQRQKACPEEGTARQGQASLGNKSEGTVGGGAVSAPASAGRKGASSGSTSTSLLYAGDAARTVPLSAAYEQFRRIAVQMYQHPASEQEFRSTMQLLSHTGLVGMDAAGFSRVSAKGGGKASKAKEGGAALSLKVQVKDIQTALRDNVLFKRVLSNLPAA
ncbi:P-loop containing nucleoside triphosphate hydrolase protein [Dunaliella salina]|uniref:P-loop containing nucleoside triphosphate hydrolase protein n=1 Tax=Dunaliella salina TaxID=3046 RepID=A0ABQ7GWV1_DUNSA|nr:P-loop containing nucleoside triphosphate hydrolase protein [Dunaliella salina]|eukprot:KAF5839088.1 P-loop containing nucleoside triphosphate hydrolase protein [Dunaliella salina]